MLNLFYFFWFKAQLQSLEKNKLFRAVFALVSTVNTTEHKKVAQILDWG
jgi:hypothetical protein